MDDQSSPTNRQHSSIGINENTSPDITLCGKGIPDNLVTHYSRGRRLILEFSFRVSLRTLTRTTPSSPSNSLNAPTSTSTIPSGFSGTYKFLNKSLFEPDGERLSGTACDYEFLSIQSSSNSSRHKTEGKFFSPNYPSPYDTSIKCAYHFMAKYNEKVRITFEKIDLGNDDLR